MKGIFQAVTDVLHNDSDLKSLVKYDTKKKNIRRAYLPLNTGDTQVIFYLQPEDVMTDFTPQIRTVPLIVRVYDREDDILVGDVAERIILLLDGADLSVAGEVFVYDCSYTGELIATHFSEEAKAFEKVMRFHVVFRVDSISGTSGVPTRKRKRNHW